MTDKHELVLDEFTLATLQSSGEILCPTCGSWTNVKDLHQKMGTLEATCPHCREK